MNTQKFARFGLLLTLAAAAALLLQLGCDSKSKQSATPANSTLDLVANPTTVTAGSTSVVEATIKSGGTGIPDQIVTFTVSPSNAGYFTPAVDTTDANGVANAIFTAITAGSASMSASVAGSGLSDNLGVSVQANQQQTGSGNVNLTVTPSLLLANGTDSAQISITVRDALGQLAPESTLVKIAAGEKFSDVDGNGYWSPGIDSLVYDANANGVWDALGNIPSTAYTVGATGQVTVRYLAGQDALTVYIKATVADNGITGYGEVPLQLSPNARIASIYLSSDSINLSVKGTGGIESALLRAVGYDQNGNPVPEGLPISFHIMNGPNGGEHLANVGYGPYDAVTNGQGMATVSIHSGTISGTIRILASSDTVLSNATQVMISAGPPKYISVGVEKCNVPFWRVINGQNKVVAVVSDTFHNPVNDSTVVYFTTEEGVVMSHMERTKNHQGLANTIWISSNNNGAGNGRVWLYAETNGGQLVDSTMFYNSDVTATLTVLGAPASVFADGTTKFVVVVVGEDLNNNPVVGGTSFEGDANFVNASGGTLEDGCFGSSARVKITSARLDVDYSRTGANDDGIGAVDLVQFWNGTAATSFSLQMLTGNAYSGSSTFTVPATASTGATFDISAIVKDRWGNPLGDHTLNLTATGGIVASNTHESDSYGYAGGYRWTAPGIAGTYTLSLTDTDPRGSGMVLTAQVEVQ